MSEEKFHELDIVHGRVDGALDCTDSGRVAENTEGLFTALEPQQRQGLIAFTYVCGVILGCVLSVLSFHYEFIAQMAGKTFVMQDWMITLILVLLGVPGVAAVKRLFVCKTCKEIRDAKHIHSVDTIPGD